MKNKKTEKRNIFVRAIAALKSARWLLATYDLFIFVATAFMFYFITREYEKITAVRYLWQTAIIFASVFSFRFAFKIYHQIWRYGGIKSYIRLLIADAFAAIAVSVIFLFIKDRPLFVFRVSVILLDLLIALSARMIYRYVYKYVDPHGKYGKIVFKVVDLIAGKRVEHRGNYYTEEQKIKIAIVGAGRVGVTLAEELINNSHAAYKPVLFIDYNKEIAGRSIFDLPVLDEKAATPEELKEFGIQEIVFALPKLDNEKRENLYSFYAQSGCKIKVYDYPTIQSAEGNGKRTLREFGIEELLFRKPVDMLGDRTRDYYKGKVVLITGGGGSIGSELARQIAKMSPKKLVLLDVYENGVYDVQQELKIAYADKLDLSVEILSVTNKKALEKVFKRYGVQIVLHAAAHKHVPLMEHNCVEAVENNVFGTLCTVELAEKYGVEHFIMVSTDKAVNPTNVMGATKRMCELIVGSHSLNGKTVFTATRFGNVLGSAGSVIPLFRKQIANGGPVTLTDKRIIRYFMTIPEASQLVLTSGAIAKNGELFVLDMGKPVKILTLAENLIRLSGYTPYIDIDIKEIGLRPGEKLYEELLVKTEELRKTDNDLIFVEEDERISESELKEKLAMLAQAVATEDDEKVKEALKSVVPTFRSPEDVNRSAQAMIDEQTKG